MCVLSSMGCALYGESEIHAFAPVKLNKSARDHRTIDLLATYLDHFFFCFFAPVAAGAILSSVYGVAVDDAVKIDGGGAEYEFYKCSFGGLVGNCN